MPKGLKNGDKGIVNLFPTKPMASESFQAYAPTGRFAKTDMRNQVAQNVAQGSSSSSSKSSSSRSSGKKSRRVYGDGDGGVYLYFPRASDQTARTESGVAVRDEWVRELLRRELEDDIFAYFGL